jgi:hypothetical protein
LEGREAKKLLDNPLLNKFFSETEEQLAAQWVNTTADQVQVRENCFYLIKMLQAFKEYLQTAIIDGDGAFLKLEGMLKK